MNETPSLAQFISLHNTSGVVEYAQSLGKNIEPTPQSAYDFLMHQYYNVDPVKTASAVTVLHPHRNTILAIANQACNKKEEFSNATGKKRRFRNFEDDEVSEYLDQAASMFNKGVEKGKELVNNLSTPQKDHTNEILKIGAVLLAGIVIGKYLMK